MNDLDAANIKGGMEGRALPADWILKRKLHPAADNLDGEQRHVPRGRRRRRGRDLELVALTVGEDELVGDGVRGQRHRRLHSPGDAR